MVSQSKMDKPKMRLCEKLVRIEVWPYDKRCEAVAADGIRCAEHKLDDDHLACQHYSVDGCKGCHPDCLSDDTPCGCGN